MAIKLENKQNVLAPNGPYPYGNIKDETGSNDGTPVDVNTYADFHQFFARMLAKSLITPNGLPENATNGFQYYEALKAVANQYKAINSYSSNTSLVDDDFGNLSVMDVNGDADFTLPALAVGTVLQKIVIMKLGTGVCEVLPDGSDVIQPGEQIILHGGDSVTLVSVGVVWLVESRHKQIERPITIHTTGTVSLTEKHLGGLSIINFAGTGTYTLPPSDAESSGQQIVLEKQQGGLITIQANGGDTIYPIAVIQLDDGDSITLESTVGLGWVVVNRFRATDFSAPDSWHAVGDGGEPAFANAFANAFGSAQKLKYKKVGNTVYLKGTIVNAGSIIQTIFTLPTDYRPTEDVHAGGTVMEVGASDVTKKIYINASSGPVAIEGAAASNKQMSINVFWRTD